MPQKACEGGIFHVRAMHIFPKMPQNRAYLFSVLFPFSNWSRAFFSKCPTFFCSFFLKCPIFPFSESDGKNGAFQEKRTEKSGAYQEKSTWSIWKREKNRKLICSILGHFRKNCICYHVKNTSFTCFLRHFMIPPVSFYWNHVLLHVTFTGY